MLFIRGKRRGANTTSCLVLAMTIVTACTLSAPQHVTPVPNVDKILVLKAKRELRLLGGEKVLKSYKVALGGSPQGHKVSEGDNKTPEGRYRIIGHNPSSQFYKSLRISYPNDADKKAAAALRKSPGGDIMVHGLGKSFGAVGKAHLLFDWTLGCIAVTNEEIDEIYASVADGTPIEIVP